ncbi:MAG: hypothetical protein J6B31_03795 [Bacteroidaceae bacterium]|nr:hypothetical protein [Bacteroidaceae bacterium]
MKMKGLKLILFAVAAMITVPTMVTSCDDWTEPEAKDYFSATANTEAYKAQLKNYFNSPHKVMFGWFGSWSAGNISNKLIGLPDSTDFVSLWLCYGNLNEAQQADLKAFQERGSKAVLCWLNTNIGENITPGVSGIPDKDEAFKHWGYIPAFGYDEPQLDASGNPILDENGEQVFIHHEYTLESHIAAAEKYAEAIADTCEKYNIDGFDADLESYGSLITRDGVVLNAFFRKLIERFEPEGRWLVLDIPGGVGWLSFYDIVDEDVLEKVKYICWQTYELEHSGLDYFFDAVKDYKPEIFEEVLSKSVITATFERAADKYLFPIHSTWKHRDGLPHAGQGAYHIEYDYPGNPDYPYVREGITTQNPPIYE